jgi:hypothetical protein
MIFLGLALLTLVYARLIWYLFERNTPMYKKWVGTALGRVAVKKAK